MEKGGRSYGELCLEVRSRMDSTIRIHDTAVMRKQKAMLPAVSIRALPEGYLDGSTRLTARLHRISVRLLGCGNP